MEGIMKGEWVEKWCKMGGGDIGRESERWQTECTGFSAYKVGGKKILKVRWTIKEN